MKYGNFVLKLPKLNTLLLWVSLSVPLNPSAAGAAQLFPFQTTYDNSGISTNISNSPPLSLASTTFTGTNVNAPYGLVSVTGLVYSQINLLNGALTLNTDPSTFGLSNSQSGSIVFSTATGDSLIANSSSTGTLDFSSLTANFAGAFTVTGGTGIFRGARGQLSFSEVSNLGPNSTVSGTVTVDGSFEIATVAEPTSALSILAFALSSGILFKLKKDL